MTTAPCVKMATWGLSLGLESKQALLEMEGRRSGRERRRHPEAWRFFRPGAGSGVAISFANGRKVLHPAQAGFRTAPGGWVCLVHC